MSKRPDSIGIRATAERLRKNRNQKADEVSKQKKKGESKMQQKTRKGHARILSICMAALLIIQSFILALPINGYAETAEAEKMTIKVGIADMPVKLAYGSKSEEGKTEDSGSYKTEKLYEYLESLGWTQDYQPAEKPEGQEEGTGIDTPTGPDVKEVKVSYELNCPDEVTPEDRQSAGGLIEYKGKKGSFTLTYDKDGDWKKAIDVDAPDKEFKVQGSLKMIKEGGTELTAAPVKGEKVILKGRKNCTTDEDGKFIIYGYSKEENPAEVLEVAATTEHAPLSIKLEDFSGTLYVKQRPSVKESDYEIEGSVNGYVAKPESSKEYSITGKGSNKVALERDGEALEKVTVTLTPEGKTTPFYVIKNGVCSEKVEDAIKIDQTAPELKDIKTEAVEYVRIKKHGIYTKQKAELLITVTVTDTESGVQGIAMIGSNDEGKQVYDALNVQRTGNSIKATFIIESQKEMLKQTLYLTGSDKVGNKAKEVLLRGSENASEITMEIVPPVVEDIEVTKGTKNENGWYREVPEFSVKTQDAESGLSDVDVTTNNSVSLYTMTYEDKETGSQTANFTLPKSVIEKEKTSSGKYAILAKAVDNSGNITAKSLDVYVDLVAPVLSLSGVEKGSHNIKAPTLTIEEDEEYYAAEGNSITINITKDDKKHYSKTFKRTNKVVIPASVFSKDGTYAVTVTAADAAGNKAKSIGTEFVKDATAPLVKIDGPSGGKYYNKAQTTKITVQERYYETNDVHIAVTRTLGKKTVKVPFSWKNTALISQSFKKFSETGTYKVSVYAVDKAGNRSATRTAAFTIDTVAPKLSIGGISEGTTYSYNDKVAPVINFSDDYLQGRKITLTRAGIDWYGKLSKSDGTGRIAFADFAKKKDNDGLYNLSITVTDKAGNSTSKKMSFTVNRYGSSFEYSDYIKDLNGKSVKNVNRALVVSEYNVSKLSSTEGEVRRDGTKVDGAEVNTAEQAGKNGYRLYRHSFDEENFDAEGVYEINVVSKDTAGNSMESKKENGKVKFTVDRTAPSISVSGYEKINKADSITLNVSVSDNLSAPALASTVDGKSVSMTKSSDGLSYSLTLDEGSRQKVNIVATDAAGNTESFSEEISVIPNGFLYFITKYKLLLVGAAAAAAALAGVFIVISKKKGDSEDSNIVIGG